MAWEAREWSRTFGRVFRAVVEWDDRSPTGMTWRWLILPLRESVVLAEGKAASPEAAMADADAWVASVVAEVADGR